MNKQSKVYKFLRIIFLTFAIISMVFGLCKKVGLCSEPNYAIAELPMPIGPGYGNALSQAELDSILQIAEQDRISTNDSGYPKISVITVSEYNDQTGQIRLNCYYANSNNTNLTVSNPADFYNTTISWTWANNGYGGCRELVLTDPYTLSMGWWKSFGGQSISTDGWTINPNGTPLMLKDVWRTGYPIYADDVVTYNGVDYFETKTSDAPTHSKGGILVEMTENDEITSEELPQVDISSPSDPSSNSGWFQKILNGIGKINNSIQSGVLTISGYVQGVYNYIVQPFDQEGFEDEFFSIPIINDFTSLGDLIDDSGVFDWSDVTPAQRVVFTFDFGGSVLPHTSNEINFDWYTGTVKTTILALMSTFLVLGLLVTIINQIPNIISGRSGDKGGGSDS